MCQKCTGYCKYVCIFVIVFMCGIYIDPETEYITLLWTNGKCDTRIRSC